MAATTEPIYRPNRTVSHTRTMVTLPMPMASFASSSASAPISLPPHDDASPSTIPPPAFVFAYESLRVGVEVRVGWLGTEAEANAISEAMAADASAHDEEGNINSINAPNTNGSSDSSGRQTTSCDVCGGGIFIGAAAAEADSDYNESESSTDDDDDEPFGSVLAALTMRGRCVSARNAGKSSGRKRRVLKEKSGGCSCVSPTAVKCQNSQSSSHSQKPNKAVGSSPFEEGSIDAYGTVLTLFSSTERERRAISAVQTVLLRGEASGIACEATDTAETVAAAAESMAKAKVSELRRHVCPSAVSALTIHGDSAKDDSAAVGSVCVNLSVPLFHDLSAPLSPFLTDTRLPIVLRAAPPAQRRGKAQLRHSSAAALQQQQSLFLGVVGADATTRGGGGGAAATTATAVAATTAEAGGGVEFDFTKLVATAARGFLSPFAVAQAMDRAAAAAALASIDDGASIALSQGTPTTDSIGLLCPSSALPSVAFPVAYLGGGGDEDEEGEGNTDRLPSVRHLLDRIRQQQQEGEETSSSSPSSSFAAFASDQPALGAVWRIGL